jgi:FkbM family methyltransferase
MLDRFEVPFAGQNVNLYTTPGGVCNAFLLKQYAYRRNGIDISAKQDDVVIDGGACWGDTSLYFSALAGESGKVFAFEFVPENRNIIAANAGLNPSFANNICIVPHPLWEKSNEIVKFSARGPSTSMMREISGMISSEVTTISIDDFVAAENHCRVDFIKMDIEGAELSALKGAEKSLRKWKPRLAISLYHKPEDLFEIPLYLNSLNLGYRFYLDHFTIYKEETVLFAIA